MKTKNSLSKQLLSLVLCLALILIYVPMTAFAADEVEGIPVGDFTIAPTDGAAVLTDGTDYTYNSGELVITTTTPVTIGMKNGVATTTDTIRIWTTSGAADITLNNVSIATSTKWYTIQLNGTVSGAKVTGDNPCTIRLVGTNTLSSTYDYGHAVRTYGDNSALTITSDSNGVLNASNVGKNGTIYAEHASDLTISGNAVVSATSQAQSALNNCGITTIGGSAKVTLSAANHGIISGNKTNHNSVVIEDSADVNITFGDSSGIYANGGMVTIGGNAKVALTGNNTGTVGIRAKGAITVSNNADIQMTNTGTYGVRSYDASVAISDNAKVSIDTVTGSGIYAETGTSLSNSAEVTATNVGTGVYGDITIGGECQDHHR